MSLNSGKLWIVATPLGNPGDLSPRARAVLSSADIILAEDTRRSGKLLAECSIRAKRFVSLHDHNESAKIKGVITELEQGAQVALVSDAGTPLISDPGYLLVRACREKGITVSPVPGPSAPITALSASGIAPHPFVFLGFAPRSKGDIHHFFSPYASLPCTILYFDRKDRLKDTLDVARQTLGHRDGCIAREMTKTFEEFIPFTLNDFSSLQLDNRELLGEITVILGPPVNKRKTDDQTVREKILELRAEFPEEKPRQLARLVEKEVEGWKTSDIYSLIAGRY